jgi:uncharacterized protein YqfB (UPF0267 family)
MMVDTEKLNSGFVTIDSTWPNRTDKNGATRDNEKMENIEYKRLKRIIRKIFLLNGKIYLISRRKSFILLVQYAKVQK